MSRPLSARSTLRKPAESPVYVPRWTPNTYYAAGQLVVNPNGETVSANANHVSGSTYTAGNWTLSSTFATVTGTQTLTNKTLTAPILGTAALISALNATGSIPSAPAATADITNYPSGTSRASVSNDASWPSLGALVETENYAGVGGRVHQTVFEYSSGRMWVRGWAKDSTPAVWTPWIEMASVGTAQTLIGKTFSPSAVANAALVVKGLNGQTGVPFVVQDSTGTSLAWIDKAGTFINEAGNVGSILNGTTGSFGTTYWGYIGSGDIAKSALALNMPAGATANIQTWAVSGTNKAWVGPDGSLNTNAGLTANGNASIGGNLTVSGTASTGALSATTGTFSGNVSAPNALTQDSGSAKRMHITAYSGGTTDASGFLTIAHGAPFTPRVIQAVNTIPASTFAVLWGIDTVGSTNFRARFLNASAAGPLVSTGTGSMYLICWE